MPGTIRISAAELDQLSRNAAAKAQETFEIQRDIENSINGTLWHSAAQASFVDLWHQHKNTLNNLQTDLEQWSRHCSSQVPIAQRVNQPFR